MDKDDLEQIIEEMRRVADDREFGKTLQPKVSPGQLYNAVDQLCDELYTFISNNEVGL